jgi:hypothetical protein
MNEAACIVYVGVFLLLPPALLVARWFDKARMPWVLLLAASVIAGWLVVNLACMFYVNGRLVQMSFSEPGLHGEFNASGETDFFLRFGWLFGPVYLFPWLFLYCFLVFGRWMFARRGA